MNVRRITAVRVLNYGRNLFLGSSPLFCAALSRPAHYFYFRLAQGLALAKNGDEVNVGGESNALPTTEPREGTTHVAAAMAPEPGTAKVAPSVSAELHVKVT